MLNAVGRQVNGRFATGNPGGPGNSLARRQFELRNRLDALTTDQDDVEVWASILRPAKAGDPVGLRMYAVYRWGNLPQAVDLAVSEGVRTVYIERSHTPRDKGLVFYDEVQNTDTELSAIYLPDNDRGRTMGSDQAELHGGATRQGTGYPVFYQKRAR